MNLLAEYVSVGGCPDRFWRSTPREVSAFFKGAQLRLERDHHAAAWLAWHTAALPRLKTFPNFEKFSGKQMPKRVKTAAEVEAIVRTWFIK